MACKIDANASLSPSRAQLRVRVKLSEGDGGCGVGEVVSGEQKIMDERFEVKDPVFYASITYSFYP